MANTSSQTVLQDTCAIIAAGGLGLRFGDPRGKQYVEVAGLPVIDWAIKAFDEAPSIGHIVVVCPAGRELETQAAVERVRLSTSISYVAGGQTRQDSCLNGLKAVPEQFKYVAIHDGARPLIQPASIETIIAVLRADATLAGAIYAHPATDTLKIVEGTTVKSTPERKQYWTVQTPQVFHREVVLAAEQQASDEGFAGTDDASFVEHAGGRVMCVESPADNFKVTVPEDRIPVEAILAARAAVVADAERASSSVVGDAAC